MKATCRASFIILVTYLVIDVVCGNVLRVSSSLVSVDSGTHSATGLRHFQNGRVRRQAPPFPTSSRDSNDQFIPRLEPPPPGSILTYDGKPISTSIGAFSLVPKSERRTPSINLNRPQYAKFRGDLPPPIPDVIPRDLPQFKNRRSVVSSFPPGFLNN